MSNAVTGAVRSTLRLEGLFVLVAATLAYARFVAGWTVFAFCSLLPDASFLGYLAGPRASRASVVRP